MITKAAAEEMLTLIAAKAPALRTAGVTAVEIEGLGRFRLAPPDPPEVPAGEPVYPEPDFGATARRARLLRPRDTDDDQEDG